MKTELLIARSGYDGITCWVHARCGFLPHPPACDGLAMIMTLQKSLMSREDHVHDVFSGLFMMRSDDGGLSWTEPVEQPGLERWEEPGGQTATICDFTPQLHRATGRLLGTGVSSRYRNEQRAPWPAPRETLYSVFDEASNQWGPRQVLAMPDARRFTFNGAGCTQWHELPGGDLLLPVYFAEPGAGCFSSRFDSVVLRCRFDGVRLEVAEVGNILTLPVRRGFVEPSVIGCGGRFWLTLRNDEGAYVTTSNDGIHYPPPRLWRFDDGAELTSHNTQQHWLTLGERLFLVYTRTGLDNDHIARNRAPLLIAEVDQRRQCLLRESERIVVPERGAQLGNFGVTQKHANEAWVCVSEWMENAGSWNPEVWGALESRFPDADLATLAATPGRCGLCELSGSDNSIYLVKVSTGSAAPLP